MGKKKAKNDNGTKDKDRDVVDEQKKKNYSLPVGPGVDEDQLPKVSIPKDKEAAILDVIQESKAQHKILGLVSNRLTAKKLTDMYNSLSGAGFSHDQIDKALTNTVIYGGDLIDALDWLCLYTPNDKLPTGFSQTFTEAEAKVRPKFVETVAEEAQSSSSKVQENATPEVLESKDKTAKDQSKETDMKSWILQYMEEESDDEEDFDGGGNVKEEDIDPNEQYLLATAKLMDAKEEASQAKQHGDKKTQMAASAKIRQYLQEISVLEKHPNFNPAVSIKGVKEEVKSEELLPQKEPAKDVEEEGLGFALFEQAAEKDEKPSPTKVPSRKDLDIRTFEYTRKQWTGKSPKQFLIDWCRKNLPKSKPPSFHRIDVRSNLFRCRAKIQRSKDDFLEVCSDIVCENVKEAEHVAATLALYHLCKGQRVYQLLPPPYRDVWMEWQDAETKQHQERKEEANKPRDQLVTRLLKKLKLDADSSTPSLTKEEEQTVDASEGSWEDLADDWEMTEPDLPTQTKPHQQKKKYLSEHMKREFLERTKKSNYQKLLESRTQLPVFQERGAIVDVICRNQVVVIAGETGSGKSTQIPQFILEEYLRRDSIESCNVIVTEPRRISTISLANRVSEELGEGAPGSKTSLCGYQIRFESRICDTTRLVYCTTGVLLRKMQQDATLQDVTHIVVDEVHERSMQSDFLLVILKKLLVLRPDLKVILMSATVDSHKFSSYFQHCPVLHIPGRTFPVEVLYLEDVIEKSGYVLEEDSKYALKNQENEEHAVLSVTEHGGNTSKMDVYWTKDDPSAGDVSGLDPSVYSLKTRKAVSLMNPERINMELIVDLIHFVESSADFCGLDGAVLIFLPGLLDIQECYDSLMTDKTFSDESRYWIVPLHSVLTSKDQSKAFSIPPKGIRKVVIATNIAETGITIPDVVFVIDSGKVKENRYIESKQMSSLEEVYISQASAKQRQGRAGRVRPGVCFRLFTRHKYDSMKSYSTPEILRVPLEELCLHILKTEQGDPTTFLSQALDPPKAQSVTKAMCLLREVGACTGQPAALTPLGHHLATLPVSVRIGKMLLYGAMLGCLEPISVIAAALTSKPPFVAPFNQREQANLAKQALAVAASDHLTICKAYYGWKDAQTRGRQAESSYCQKHYLKRQSLIEMENVKEDLTKLIQKIGFDKERVTQVTSQVNTSKAKKDEVLEISKTPSSDASYSFNMKQISLVKAVLAAGLYPNVAQISYEPPVDAVANPSRTVCTGTTPQGTLHAHPSSVNRFLEANGWLVYHEKVKLSKVYMRDSTLITPYPILLFGGDITVQHTQQLITVEDWIQFKSFAKTAVIFKELRTLIDTLLKDKLENPGLDFKDNPAISILIDLITSERFKS
ncbi:ATP-dependent RNA helicase dhx29 [Lingula anatina]|uniref:RNA helicase n=1 Tax=Lingula anatina TaxID=7574 RepID=A0A1S3JFE4_LINAN|nr:ATP-dependent RNA helicase dhx29 [Lingula anatina]|eukprot:XP_013409135.1 ATP-dependent RNA helicase dhx29 [Lingula anatina]